MHTLRFNRCGTVITLLAAAACTIASAETALPHHWLSEQMKAAQTDRATSRGAKGAAGNATSVKPGAVARDGAAASAPRPQSTDRPTAVTRADGSALVTTK